MTLQQIRYFLALCEERNFTRAAKKCGVRQPTLSQVVQRLERELGEPLFVRSNPIRLTGLGAALQPRFRRVDETVEKTRRYAADQVSILKAELKANFNRIALSGS